jgi:anti-sigma regulatory factor (Ser/Thr protein kinase)
MYDQTAGHSVSDEIHCAGWSRTFPATPDQTGQARRFLTAILNGSALADDAVTCLGELASNAIIHSHSCLPGGTFTVRVHTRPGRLRVEVHDNGGPWAPRHTGDGGGAGPATGGRGLLIVSRLADRWDITPTTTAPYRTAWFEMDRS